MDTCEICPNEVERELKTVKESLGRLTALLRKESSGVDSTERCRGDSDNKEIEVLRRELKTIREERDALIEKYKDSAINRIANQGALTDEAKYMLQQRERTNSELRVFADQIDDADTRRTVQGGDGDRSLIFAAESALGDGSPNIEKASYRLLKCSDEQCEVFKPKNGDITTTHQSRTNVQLMWDEKPKTALVIKKPNERDATLLLKTIGKYLTCERGIRVYVEPVVHSEVQMDCLSTWKPREFSAVEKKIDFIVCLGGDGTILWVSQLFQNAVPPVISFAMGSLGFLTPFDQRHWKEHIEKIIRGGFYLTLRSRVNSFIAKGGVDTALATDVVPVPHADPESGWIQALNEVVIDRGPSSALVDLDCYCDGHLLTKVAADGIIVATPTGSTAYSLSAGGSMVHPSVHSMLFTPICPHSLSFRPILFPDSATLKIQVPLTSRTSAIVSFDAKNRIELLRGDALFIKVSPHPVPAVCEGNENRDWFHSVKKNLHWNVRQLQKPFGSGQVGASDERNEQWDALVGDTPASLTKATTSNAVSTL